MGRYKAQFQRGLSDFEFDRLYGTEEKCREALFAWRWPEGFVCPACGGRCQPRVRSHCCIRGTLRRQMPCSSVMI